MGLYLQNSHHLLGQIPLSFYIVKYFIQKKAKHEKIEKIEKNLKKITFFYTFFSGFREIEIWAFDPFSHKNNWA